MVNLGRLLALFAVVLYTANVQAQQPDSAFWVPNGPVNAIAIHDTTVILGGNFNLVTPVTGSFVRMDTASGDVDPGFYKVNGTVYATAIDSAGNIYVGGRFTKVGRTSVNNIFRMKPDGTFDPTFVHDVSGTVYCMALHDTDLFIGGDFTGIDAEIRNNFGAIALNTGEVNLCNPNVNGPVYTCALELASGGMIIGGDFTQVGNFVPHYLAKISLYNGLPFFVGSIVWSATPNIDGPVYDLEVTEYRCYVAGDFTWAGTTPRRGLAVVLKSDGTLLPADAQLNGPAYTLNRIDTTWFVGGDFSSAGAQQRNNIAWFDWNFNLKPWNPGADAPVRTIISMDHERLFVGGEFQVFGGDSCSRGAIVHTNLSMITQWNPNLNGAVYTAVCDSLQRLYVGGAFFGAGGEKRNNLCAISLNTGRVTAWNPDVNAPVYTLSLSGDSVYFAGDFTAVSATPRARLAAIELSSGLLLPFNPGVNGLVRTIAVTNSGVYVGGNFTLVGGQPRNNIGKLNTATGTALNWNPNCLGTVNTILATPNWIYVSGFFSSIGTQTRQNLARINPTTALPDLNWICDTDDGIYHAELYNGKLAIGGWFDVVNGQSASDFALVDTTSLQTQAHSFSCDGFVRTFSIYGDDFFLSGAFTTVNSVYQPHLVAYDEGNNVVDTWAPSPDAAPVAMCATATHLFIGGQMETTAGAFHPYFQVLHTQWITSVPEQEMAVSPFTVFPNPTSGTITVNQVAAFERYVLTDVTGQIVKTGIVNASSLEISLEEFTSGMYVLTLSGETVAPVSQTVIRQ